MKAITFGSAMIDIITVVSSESIEQLSLSNSNRQFLLVEPGRKVEAETITRHIGGGAINTGICFKKLGCEVSPIVKMGNDVPRDYIVKNCIDHGLSMDKIFIDDEQSTGSAVMIASHEKNAAIFTHRGANTTLAQRTGAFFSSNPGIRQITTRANTVLSAAANMSLISINEVEAAAMVPSLTEINEDFDWGDPAKDDPIITSQGVKICLKKFCEILHSRGPKNVLITYGSDGAYLYDGETLHHQAVIPVKVAGTAGAGDSFVSTLAWGLRSGHSAKQALLQAAHNASSVVSHVNTTDGLLSADELAARVS